MDLQKYCGMLYKPMPALHNYLIDVLTHLKLKSPSALIIDKLYKLFPEQSMTIPSKDKVDFLINSFKEDNEPLSIADLMKYITEKELKQFMTVNTKIGGRRYTKKSTRRKTQKGGDIWLLVRQAKAFLLGAIAGGLAMPLVMMASDGANRVIPYLPPLLGGEEPQLPWNENVLPSLMLAGAITVGIMYAATEE
jgi:hypothetical protein